VTIAATLARWRDRVAYPVRARVVSGVVAAGTGSVLAAAIWLEPASDGHGTHLQLGLNPCTILSATGYPCPMCGATTTFALWAHLRPIDAILNQPFASLLFLMTASAFAISVVEIVRPARRWERLLIKLEPHELPLAGGFLVAMCASWIYKAWLMT
jgi:hypothetical protein